MDHNQNRSSGEFTINAELLDRFRHLDDATLQRAISQIASACGVSERQAEKATGNVNRIRHQLSTMKEEDLQTLASRIQPETTQEIVKTLKTEGLL